MKIRKPWWRPRKVYTTLSSFKLLICLLNTKL